jgi:hypothetical protein
MSGWFQAIHASFSPSGDGVGYARNWLPDTMTRMFAGLSAADPSSGTPTIARVTADGPSPVCSSRTHHTSVPSGERTGSA